jgi:5'-3' exonuclease
VTSFSQNDSDFSQIKPLAESETDFSQTETVSYEDIFDFVLYKAILGDASDNIPSSCSGVGKATANEMVRFVKHYLNDTVNNILAFPRNEILLKEACDTYDVKYRKAYMNWDLTRFSKNIELVDLARVPITSQIVKSMIASIRNSETSADYIKAVKLLSALEIKDVAIDEITREATFKRKYLWCDNENK